MSHRRYNEMINHKGLRLNLSYFSYCHIFFLCLCCSGLNFLDLLVRQGTIDNPPKPPVIPGFECSGIVESVGENTAGLEVNGFTKRFTLLNDH